MVNWINSGSFKDLSQQVLKPDPVSVIAPTSQHGGNQIWDNNAMTAPGGVSGDLGDGPGQPSVAAAPVIELSIRSPLAPGTDGKPQADSQTGAAHYGPPAWGKTTVPQTIRKAQA